MNCTCATPSESCFPKHEPIQSSDIVMCILVTYLPAKDRVDDLARGTSHAFHVDRAVGMTG